MADFDGSQRVRGSVEWHYLFHMRIELSLRGQVVDDFQDPVRAIAFDHGPR